MTNQTVSEGYNERLFVKPGLRSYVHLSRFRWLAQVTRDLELDCSRTIELGCFDGRALDWLPDKPNQYLGIDAGWEGGIELGERRFESDDQVRFLKSSNPDWEIPKQPFTLAIALETLEHLEPDSVSDYLKRMAQSVDGYFLVSVPNELGPVFLSKWLAKSLFYRDQQSYKPSELFYASLGKLDRVARDDHKGFDYREMVREVGEHFEVLKVVGVPGGLTPCLSVTVGIVAKSR